MPRKTLAVVAEVLRKAARPLTPLEIVLYAGAELPSRSRTPNTVVARDLALDIIAQGEGSLFMRVGPGLYALRELALARGMEPWRFSADALRPPSASARKRRHREKGTEPRVQATAPALRRIRG